MTDHDRGVYTPQTDAAPLAFDARQPQRRRPVPVTLILSMLILLALIVALVLIYQQGVRSEGDAPQPVGTPVGAVREAPPPEAQPADPAASLNVYTDEGPTVAPEAPAFVAPPEQPMARPTAPVVTTPSPRPLPAPPVASRPATPPATPAAPNPASAAPPRATPAPTPAPVPTPAPAASGGGSAAVQIGAFNTRELAQSALASAAGGRSTRIQEVEVGGRTLYRAQILFPDRTAAQAYCSGRSSCIVR